MRGVRELAALYGTDPNLQALEERRRELGVDATVALCFGAANLNALLIDDGLRCKNQLIATSK